MKKYTKKQLKLVRKGLEMWEWLADNPNVCDKRKVPQYSSLASVSDNACAFCAIFMTENSHGDEVECNDCPLGQDKEYWFCKWFQEAYEKELIIHGWSSFETTAKQRQFFATKIAEAHRKFIEENE